MYVIKYDRDIYAGTYSDMDGCYLYPSSWVNNQKPKVFKTLKGAEKHLSNLKNKVVYGKDTDVYNFKIIEWSENDLESHLMFVGGKGVGVTLSSPVSLSMIQKWWLFFPTSIPINFIYRHPFFVEICENGYPQHLDHKTWFKIRIQRLI